MNPEELAIKGNQHPVQNELFFLNADTALFLNCVYVWLHKELPRDKLCRTAGRTSARLTPLPCVPPIWSVLASTALVLDVPFECYTSVPLHPTKLIIIYICSHVAQSVTPFAPLVMTQSSFQYVQVYLLSCSFALCLSHPQGSCITFLQSLHLSWQVRFLMLRDGGADLDMGICWRKEKNLLFTLSLWTTPLQPKTCIFQGRRAHTLLKTRVSCLIQWQWFNASPTANGCFVVISQLYTSGRIQSSLLPLQEFSSS